MPLGREVGLGPGNIVLDRDPAPPPQKGHSPQFSAHVCCGQTARQIKMPHDREVGLGLDHIVLGGDAALTLPKWHTPNVRSMSIVTKWSPISATAELLYPSSAGMQ